MWRISGRTSFLQHDGPKLAPRWPQDGPKRAPMRPKMAPRGPKVRCPDGASFAWEGPAAENLLFVRPLFYMLAHNRRTSKNRIRWALEGKGLSGWAHNLWRTSLKS